MDPPQNLNELLLRCLKFRKTVAQENPVLFEELVQIDATVKEKLLSKIDAALSQKENVTVTANLFIEKQFASHGPQQFVCDPAWTVWTTKKVIKEKFAELVEIACHDMNILCGNSIAEDAQTLRDCGVQDNDDAVYVYVSKRVPRATNDSVLTDSSSYSSVDETPAAVLQFASTSDQNVSMRLTTNLRETEAADNQLCNDPVEDVVKDRPLIGWPCPKCTFLNEPTRPGCLLCTTARPESYVVPDNHSPSVEEQQRIQRELEVERLRQLEEAKREKEESESRKINYDRHISAAHSSIVLSGEEIECLICLTTTDSGNGVMLQSCLHTFCKDCLVGHITSANDALIACPYVDENYSCTATLQDREIRALLSSEEYQSHLSRSLAHAETQSSSSFHCKTPDCAGWCEYEDGVNTFDCPVCKAVNCLSCQVIHHPKDCAEYQSELKRKSGNDREAKKTKAAIDKMLRTKSALRCPQCKIVIMRRDGCDWVLCSMCKLEICWVTRGPRWGPKGKGDISGGCRCNVKGKKCHSDCVNCH